MKIVLLNGPPRSGKDALGRRISDVSVREMGTSRVILAKFANVLKLAVHRAFDLQGVGPEEFDSCKDQPSAAFHGATPRAAYIQFSEQFAKPLFGKRYFGERLGAMLAPHDSSDIVAVVTDSGFVEEAQALVDRFGAENVTLVRLSRPGATFEGDSRSYWEPTASMGGLLILPLRNDGPIESLDVLARQVLDVVGVRS